jgi:hypothetical protein
MTDESQNPTTSESEAGTSIEKFETPEARDKAYLELEAFSKTQARRLSDLEKKLDEMAQPAPREPESDQRSFTDLYPAAQPSQDQRESQLASRILTTPSQVLREHAEYVRKETLREVNSILVAQQAISNFQRENPDLANHEGIVRMYVDRTPQSLSPAERLKRAAPEARAYLASIAKGNPASTNLDPANYVESPTQRPTSAAPAPAQPSEEDELTEMIRERSAIQAKKRL